MTKSKNDTMSAANPGLRSDCIHRFTTNPSPEWQCADCGLGSAGAGLTSDLLAFVEMVQQARRDEWPAIQEAARALIARARGTNKKENDND